MLFWYGTTSALIDCINAVLSSKMSVDITHSDDLNESCDKTAEEIPLVCTFL